MTLIYIILLCILSISIVLFFSFNKIYIKTSAMAVVMALGIVTEGALLSFFGMHFFRGIYGKLLSTFNLSLWTSFIFSLSMTCFKGKFKELHYSHPINRFGIGTWVAGTSICGIIIYKEFPQWGAVSEVLTFLNAGLWAVYLGLCMRSFYVLSHSSLKENSNGILLLTTVSTQSIVLLSNTIFAEIPLIINKTLLMIGFCFYMVSAFYIIKRYITSSWIVETDWNNTNCILHGAISISGIACITTKVLDERIIQFIWIAALTVFILIECIELWRLILRIKRFGINKGILIYDVTQWSRIFTFAMFYTFTSLISIHAAILSFLKNIILSAGIWIILFLLIMEALLSIQFVFNTYKKSAGRRQTENGVTFPS